MRNSRKHVILIILAIITVCTLMLQTKITSAISLEKVVPKGHNSVLSLDRVALYSQLPDLKDLYIPRARGEDEDGPSYQGHTGHFGPSCERDSELPPLTALAPGTGVDEDQDLWGADTESKSAAQVTAISNPTFWFYIPYQFNSSSDIKAEFELIDFARGRVSKHLYQIEGTPGIVHIKLPDGDATQASNLDELEVLYDWLFQIDCTPEEPDGNPFVRGKVKRVLPTQADQPSNTTTSLISLNERVISYAQDGLWNEVLSTIIDKIYPINPARAHSLLEQLLSSRYVNLGELADAPIVDCCELVLP